MFVVVLAAAFLAERLTGASVAATVVGLLGLLALEGSHGFSGPGIGDVLVLGGALSAAVYTIVVRRIETTLGAVSAVDCLTLTAQQFLVAALTVAPFACAGQLFGGEPAPHAPARFWVAAVAVGVLGFAASFLLYNRAIALVTARASAIVLNLIPVFGVLGAVVGLGERPGLDQLVGVGLISASVAGFTLSEWRHAPDMTASAAPADVVLVP